MRELSGHFAAYEPAVGKFSRISSKRRVDLLLLFYAQRVNQSEPLEKPFPGIA